ncbi:MAG: tetratricopeptide repeat protein [Thermoproteota archaeon]|nr:tetratricopeptide repeat protein [Thermoproteota archaeon]
MTEQYSQEIEEVNRYVDSGRYPEALERLQVLATLQLDKWEQARINYLIVSCLANSGRYPEALERLQVLASIHKWEQARINYLNAYCLHSLGIDLNNALDNYNLALEKGYDEFWVLYNRGVLYMELGNIEAARIDLDRASALDPSHEGAKQFRDGVFLPPLLDKDQQQIMLTSPVVACCVPKSGTMLLTNLLKSILGDYLVIPSNSFRRPLATAEYLLALPALTNRVYVGHIWYSEDLAKKLASIPKIVLVRDPRDTVVSYTHFMDRIAKDVFGTQEEYWSKREWDEKLSTMIFGLNTRLGWKSYPSVFNSFVNYGIRWASPNTLIVRYEDIIGTKYGGNDQTVIKTMKSLLDFIGVQIDGQTLKARIEQGSDPTKSETFRSGGGGNWGKEFKPQHVTQMKAVGPTLVSTLGYELNENWNLNTRNKKRILARIKVKPDFSHNMAAISKIRYLHIRKKSGGKKRLERMIDEWALNIFIENEHYQDAILILEQLINQEPSNPIWNYLYALSLHQLKKDLDKALRYYNSALENGYDEFWVKYNRGLLLIKMGDKEAATADLERAQRLKPDDKATRESLMTMQTTT